MSRFTIVIIALAILCGCSHTPTPHYYVLGGPPLAATARSGARIGLGPITLPDYLDRPQVVTAASASGLEFSNAARWAEPLSSSFKRALLTNLLHELPESDVVLHPWRASLGITQQVNVEVLHFEPDSNGNFVLAARWRTTAADGDDSTHTETTTISVPLGGHDDNDTLVAAANSAVATLAAQLAVQLKVR